MPDTPNRGPGPSLQVLLASLAGELGLAEVALIEMRQGDVKSLDTSMLDSLIETWAPESRLDPRIVRHAVRFALAKEAPRGLLGPEPIPVDRVDPRVLAERLGRLLGDPTPAGEIGVGSLPGLWNAFVRLLHRACELTGTTRDIVLGCFLDGAGHVAADSRIESCRKHFLRSFAAAAAAAKLDGHSWKVTSTQMAVIGSLEPVSCDALVDAIRSRPDRLTPGAFRMLFRNALGKALAVSRVSAARTGALLTRCLRTIKEVFSGMGLDGEVLFVPREVAALVRELIARVETEDAANPAVKGGGASGTDTDPLVDPPLEQRLSIDAGGTWDALAIGSGEDSTTGGARSPSLAASSKKMKDGMSDQGLRSLRAIAARLAKAIAELRASFEQSNPVIGGLLPFGLPTRP